MNRLFSGPGLGKYNRRQQHGDMSPPGKLHFFGNEAASETPGTHFEGHGGSPQLGFYF
jgi:hypothetical protein